MLIERPTDTVLPISHVVPLLLQARWVIERFGCIPRADNQKDVMGVSASQPSNSST